MKLLVVVDFQNDFVNGALGFKGAENLDERIAEKINLYRNNGDEIVFTMDTHYDDYNETQEGKLLPIKHCIENSQGWQLFGKTAEAAKSGDLFFKKPCFGSAELFDYLRSNSEKYAEIEFVGLVSYICVISNVVLAKTALPEVTVKVDKNCISGGDNELNEAVVNVMKAIQVEII